MSAFRAYENFVEEAFLLYCMSKETASGVRAKPFLNPRSFRHAADMMKSSQPFLDWASPDKVIKRAELYLDGGYPLKDIYISNLEVLRQLRHIRNHIAHNSEESKSNFLKVLRVVLKTLPVQCPTPGEFILMNDSRSRGNLFLHSYLDKLEAIAAQIGV